LPTPLLLAGVLMSVLTFASPQPREQSIASWTPQPGDTFHVDTETNMGRITHVDGRTLTFPVITGQRRTVNYIGLRYFAATPKQTWTVKTMHTQPDRITYGPDGRFLRLYDEGRFTHYGIHAHTHEDIMFERDNRHQSMGCIVVRKEILDVLEETWRVSGERLEVTTY
jgi:hypothetical protein